MRHGAQQDASYIRNGPTTTSQPASQPRRTRLPSKDNAEEDGVQPLSGRVLEFRQPWLGKRITRPKNGIIRLSARLAYCPVQFFSHCLALRSCPLSCPGLPGSDVAGFLPLSLLSVGRSVCVTQIIINVSHASDNRLINYYYFICHGGHGGWGRATTSGSRHRDGKR